MSVYALYLTGRKKKMLRFSDEKQAMNHSNGFILVKNKEDIVNNFLIGVPQLVEIYNKIVYPNERVKGFDNREQAAAMLLRMAVNRLEEQPQREIESVSPVSGKHKENKEGERLKPTSSAKKESKDVDFGKLEKESDGEGAEGKEPSSKKQKRERGRPRKVSKKSGQKLYPSEGMKRKNPHHRPGAKNYESMEIIRNNPGISYEEYVDKGGMVKTLRRAKTEGNVIIVDSENEPSDKQRP